MDKKNIEDAIDAIHKVREIAERDNVGINVNNLKFLESIEKKLEELKSEEFEGGDGKKFNKERWS